MAQPTQPFVLPAAFDASVVREVYGRLKEHLAADAGDLTLDGTGVETVDVAAGQLLAAVGLTGRHVHLKASPVLEAFLKLTALEVVLAPEH